jgi:hypothetical protein
LDDGARHRCGVADPGHVVGGDVGTERVAVGTTDDDGGDWVLRTVFTDRVGQLPERDGRLQRNAVLVGEGLGVSGELVRELALGADPALGLVGRVPPPRRRVVRVGVDDVPDCDPRETPNRRTAALDPIGPSR